MLRIVIPKLCNDVDVALRGHLPSRGRTKQINGTNAQRLHPWAKSGDASPMLLLMPIIYNAPGAEVS